MKINGTVLDDEARTTRAEFIMNDDTWVEYPVPPVLTNVEIVVEYS